MTAIPTLQTERLILRAPVMKDWPAYHALMSTDRALYMGGPHSTKAAWGMFCHDVALWTLEGHGALMMQDRATGECLGQVGINYGPLFPERELGWLVYPQAEGKSYAYEAAVALRNWAFAVRGLKTLVSYIAPPNVRSIRLAERLGAVPDATAERQAGDEDDLVFRHPSPLAHA